MILYVTRVIPGAFIRLNCSSPWQRARLFSGALPTLGCHFCFVFSSSFTHFHVKYVQAEIGKDEKERYPRNGSDSEAKKRAAGALLLLCEAKFYPIRRRWRRPGSENRRSDKIGNEAPFSIHPLVRNYHLMCAAVPMVNIRHFVPRHNQNCTWGCSWRVR
jgi:hypothetical protein